MEANVIRGHLEVHDEKDPTGFRSADAAESV